MKYTIEMGSGAMIYTTSFINIGSGIQKLLVMDTHIDTWTDRHADSKVMP
jgi:tetrahydrodipicolinate N-succinyltransferase